MKNMSRSRKNLFVAFSLLLVASASFVVFADATEDAAGESEAVMTLTKANFNSFIKENDFVLVEFYAPWCGHCKKLAPEYEQAAKTLKESGSATRLGKVDATQEEDLASKYDVTGYPTLKLFRSGKPEEYKGGRTADAIVTWLESMSGSAIVIKEKAAEAEALAAEAVVAYLGAFTAKDSAQFKVYQEVAEANRLLGKFIAYFDPKAKNEVQVYRKDEGAATSHPVGKKDDFAKFCREERFPYFGPIDGDNYNDYMESGLSLVWFAGDPTEYNSASEAIRSAAKQFRAKNSFVWLDTEKFKDHAQTALGVKDFPALVLQAKKDRFVYPHDKFAEKTIVEFMKNVASGKVAKNLLTEEIPEKNDDAVKIVVGKNFKDMVLSPQKDVLLEVYAPWCGHCKKFEPIYKEFAETMAPNKNVVIAKMDGTTNEPPVPGFEWKGFPTIFFVKAGTDKPVLYEGERRLDDLLTYIKENASKPFDLEAPVKEEL